MAELSPDIIEQIADACKAGAGDAGGSLSSALDSTMQIVDVAGDGPQSLASLPEELAAPGLGLILQLGDAALALLMPEATNLLPAWYAQPDPTGESKLQTLGQELSMLLLPDDLEISKFTAGAVANLAHALSEAQAADPLGWVQLSLEGDDGKGTFYLCWPLAHPEGFLPKTEPAQPAPEVAGPTAETMTVEEVHGYDIESLPSYSRSLLNIHVPVVVRLASTKMSVEDIVNLGQGSIIQFDKSCDDSLDLEAGGQKLAAGEAVKVGDKFGLRITSIQLPDERYLTVGKKAAG